LLHRTFFYSHPPDNLFSVDLSRIQVFLIWFLQSFLLLDFFKHCQLILKVACCCKSDVYCHWCKWSVFRW
jgi:hypothetical protein